MVAKVEKVQHIILHFYSFLKIMGLPKYCLFSTYRYNILSKLFCIQNNTVIVGTRYMSVSQYWIKKCLITKTSQSCSKEVFWNNHCTEQDPILAQSISGHSPFLKLVKARMGEGGVTGNLIVFRRGSRLFQPFLCS